MQHAVAHDQVSLDYLKHSAFRVLADYSDLSFRIDGSQYFLYAVDPEGNEIHLFEGPRIAAIDFMEEMAPGLAWHARKQVFIGEPDFSGEACSLILTHIRDVLTDGDTQKNRWVLAWLAEAAQNPMMEEALDKPSAILIRGPEGAGKSIIVEKVFSKVLGRAIALVQDDPLDFRRTYDPAWAVLKASAKYVGNSAYFDALAHEIKNGGIEAFYQYLLNPALLDGVDLRNPLKMKELA